MYSIHFTAKTIAKGSEWIRMRLLANVIFMVLMVIGMTPEKDEDEVTFIVEVEGDAAKHATHIQDTMPQVEVVAVYTLLFQGIAVKGSDTALKKVAQLDFVQERYPVQTYEALTVDPQDSLEGHVPAIVNDTTYTGKGVKVGVIDTGIDYTHPDLRANYIGGYDLVDLDDDPMETTEGLKTLHGTHVAGIIASDGSLQGVAPDAELYGYRALGPGGAGTSIQVIAAMEEAVRDGVDVINLSLGNTVNGPDYPTSKAVSKASEHGVAVVVANGNAGPENWTVAAPATSEHALSVGAYSPEARVPSLFIKEFSKNIPLQPLDVTAEWALERDYELTTADDVRGKIALLPIEETTITDEIVEAQKDGATAIILYEEKPLETEWIAELEVAEVDIPVAAVSVKDGRWLRRHVHEQKVYAETEWEEQAEMVAPFSSRGPVTVNWQMKPDLIAPGVRVVSTVPDGYEALNGTSMAAPHVAGAIALMKEAKPSWSNEQIFHALKTTATPLEAKSGERVAPIEQGAGLLQVADAINTDIIIHNIPLTFGFVHGHIADQKQTIQIENLSQEEREFRFVPPHAKKGLSWNLPQKVTIGPDDKKEVPIELKSNSILLEEGIYEDWLLIESEEEEFSLPYIIINETSNYPKVMGFTFQMNQFDDDMYQYQLYVPEQVTSIQIKMYDPDSLLYKGTLMELSDLEVGMNEGEIDRSEIKHQGEFYGIIAVELENGEIAHYDTRIYLE